MSKNIKTFRALLIKDNMSANDIAQLVKINGALYRNSWGAWEASLPGDTSTKDEIKAALDALSDYASAVIYRDSECIEEHYDSSIHHSLDNFGFTVGEDNKLLVEKSAVQKQEERIGQLESELTSAKSETATLRKKLNEISTWTGFDDVEEDLIPKELDVALQVYSSGIKEYNQETGKMNNKETTKKWLKDKAAEFFEEVQKDTVYERIATVANWKKEGGRPKKT